MRPSSIPFTLMRGGTSKGVFLRAHDLPSSREDMTPLILDLFGSPDRRQIDGLGGAEKLTSKVAIIGAPTRPGTDLTYLFGQVGVGAPEIDFRANCGNLTSAVAVYAIEEGLVRIVEGITTVAIHNVNTDKIIYADVQVRDGQPLIEGDLAIGGVPGTGAPIALDFSGAAGAATGKLLPFDEPVANLDIEGIGQLDVSVVDCANLVIFVEAARLGMSGTESPAEIDGNKVLVAKIDAIRKVVAHRMGLGEYWDSRQAPSVPFLVAVAAAAAYRTFTTGQEIRAESIDLVCRSYATGCTHQALPTTVTACLGAACRIEGTLPHRLLGPRACQRDLIQIGHPSGVIEVEARVVVRDGLRTVELARIFRTARRLADGTAYLKKVPPRA